MLKVKFITIGTIKEPYLKLGIDEYTKRLERFVDLSIVEIPETPLAAHPSPKDIQVGLSKDVEKIKNHIIKHAVVIIFDIHGQSFDSVGMAKKIDGFVKTATPMVFVMGGSHGIEEGFKKSIKEKWSFSPLTFPHQLFRLIALEQLYRSFTILSNHPYHK